MARTLADLETDIRFLYDLIGFENRHPQATVFKRINANYRSLRDRLTSAGSPLFLSSTEVTQATTGRTVAYSGTLLSDAVMSTFGIVKSVMVKNGSSWLPLQEVYAGELDVFDGGEVTGIPTKWCAVGVSAESGTSATTQHLGVVVWPSLDMTRTFRVTGLRAWTDLTLGTDAIPDNMGLCDWLVAAVGLELTNRDDNEKLWVARKKDADDLYQEILCRSKMRTGGSRQRVNVRARGR